MGSLPGCIPRGSPPSLWIKSACLRDKKRHPEGARAKRKSGMKLLKTFFEFISRGKKKPKLPFEEVRIRPLGEMIEEMRKKEQRESSGEEKI